MAPNSATNGNTDATTSALALKILIWDKDPIFDEVLIENRPKNSTLDKDFW